EERFDTVVREEIAADRVLHLVLGEIACTLADDDAKLDLVVELAGLARRDRVVVWPANAARDLVEDDRLFRNWHAGFRRMVGIVEADGDEVLHVADAGAKARLGRDLSPSRSAWLSSLCA